MNGNQTEIHDTHTCPCEMCVWARETAANKPESPSEGSSSEQVVRVGFSENGPSSPSQPPKTATSDDRSAQDLFRGVREGFGAVEGSIGQETQTNPISVPTFIEEWESAPRAMIRYVEQSVAEYWFLRGVRAGEAGAMVTMNEDLREIRRVAGERLTTTIREGR